MVRRKRSFTELVDHTGDCWLWFGERMPNGYGRFYIGTIDGKRVAALAHRYAWEQANRPLRSGEVVRHSCDNPPCVNPAHLTVGSQGDNLRDAATKDHLAGSIHGKGTNHRFAKLTDQIVIQIRQLSQAGMTQRAIAAKFGVNQSQISRVLSGDRWSHV